MLQDDYRKLYKRINKDWQDSVSIYRSLVTKYIDNDTTVLEAGCGFSNMFEDEYRKAKKVIGVDVCRSFIEKNPLIKEKIVASIEAMPQVTDSSIDLIISSWVFEHVEKPKKAFLEFARVLKKRGRVVFLTPNTLNYVVLANRLIPEWFRNLVVKRLAKKTVVDPMPAFYRANSPSKLNRLAGASGLAVEELRLNGDPTYIAVNKLAFRIGVIIERFLNLPLLSSTKVHMIGVLRKE